MPFESETIVGASIQAGATQLFPFVHTVRVHLPGARLNWSRPTSVLAQTPDGQELVLPVKDVTRQAQLTLLGLGVLGSLIIWYFYRK
jgi:hypothetical protein